MRGLVAAAPLRTEKRPASPGSASWRVPRVHASKRQTRAVLAAGTASFGLLLTPGAAAPARAQVMEIAPDGKVAVHDRPAIFTETGVQTIAPPRPATTRTVPSFAPTAARKLQVMQELSAVASAYRLRADLVQAVARRESRFRHDAGAPPPPRGLCS